MFCFQKNKRCFGYEKNAVIKFSEGLAALSQNFLNGNGVIMKGNENIALRRLSSEGFNRIAVLLYRDVY